MILDGIVKNWIERNWIGID